MKIIVTKENLTKLLNTPRLRNIVVAKALVLLKNRQTYDEQRDEITKYDNNIGFTPGDAKRGVSMAKFYERKGYLTDAQVRWWMVSNEKGFSRITKYHAQLNVEANIKLKGSLNV